VIAVGNTPVQVMDDNPSRYSILLYNNGGDSAYLGDSSVSVATGFPLAPAQGLTDEESSDETWPVSPTSTELRIILTQA
jgi:hypothetical protein